MKCLHTTRVLLLLFSYHYSILRLFIYFGLLNVIMVCNYVILYFIYPMLLLLVQGIYNIGLHFYDYYMTKIGRVTWFKRQTVPKSVVFDLGSF